LDEVTALVEMPTVYVGEFEKEFLEVPAECLILTMKLNQKYFPLFAADGTLSSRFLIVSNMKMDDAKNVIEGNQRVVRPRLADARFFFTTDKRTKLADRLPKLASVVYHNKLGSQGERMARVRAIAGAIAGAIANEIAATLSQANASNGNTGAEFQASVDQAVQLSKADLVTDMVGEFPELQGTMGKYYALNEGINREVAEAIEDHYKPRFAGDTLPRSDVGVVVALADKLETLAGLFGIGQLPTGDKDPFGLRRHALGVIRMLIERKLPIGLDQLITIAFDAMGALVTEKDAPNLLRDFIYDRLAGNLREHGYTANEVDAVLALRPARLVEVAARLEAVRVFSSLSEAAALAAANKRIGNILKKSDGVTAAFVDAKLTESAEKSLSSAMTNVLPRATAHFEKADYTESLKSLAALRAPVDEFFEHVMVNAEDPAVRANRLGLLATLHREMNRVADLSKLAA
jgi:glycyl-tRNA synthetase beta chain